MSGVLIWSGEHQAYWRENSAGYTTDKAEAGRYNLGDAMAILLHAGPEKQLSTEEPTDDR